MWKIADDIGTLVSFAGVSLKLSQIVLCSREERVSPGAMALISERRTGC